LKLHLFNNYIFINYLFLFIVEYDEDGNVIVKEKPADELDEEGNVIVKEVDPNLKDSNDDRDDKDINKDINIDKDTSINPPEIKPEIESSNLPSSTDDVPITTVKPGPGYVTDGASALSSRPTTAIGELNTDLNSLNGEEGDDNNKIDNNYIFVTGGEGLFKFWKIIGNNLVFTVGLTEEPKKKTLKPSVPGIVIKNTAIKRKEKVVVKKESISTTIVNLHIPQYSAVGDSNGLLWLWDGYRRNRKHIGHHKGEITSSVSTSQGFISASPVSIKIWNCKLNEYEVDESTNREGSRHVSQGIDVINNSNNSLENQVPEIIDNNINPTTVVSKATRSSLGISFGKNKNSNGKNKNKLILPPIEQNATNILNIGLDNKKIKKLIVDVNILREILISDIVSSLNRSEYLLWTGSDHFNRIRY
jgi:hypothetical protein